MACGGLLWAAILALFTLSAADVSNRTVETVLYPDCKSYPRCREIVNQNASAPNVSFPNVAYVRSYAGDDVLHFVMSTVKHPSVLVVHTTGDRNQQLNFNWTHLLLENVTDMTGAIFTNGSQYHGHVKYSFVLVFSRLIEYDDFHDSANMETAKNQTNVRWNIRDFNEFMWMNVTKGKGGNSIIFNTSSLQPTPYGNNSKGFMYFEFEINHDSGRDADLPRLIYNSNNTQMNFVLDGYVPLYNKSRFALEMTIVANHTSEYMSVQETESIDDEYSPGVFQVVNWFSRIKSHDPGYLQWKPVCYLASERSRGEGTKVHEYGLENPRDITGLEDMLEESLAMAFFGGALNDSKAVSQTALHVSFGLSQDGYYLKNNYTVWTASIGYGKAPEEAISTLVIIIIAAGLGIPVVIILFGGIYVCIKRRRNGYEQVGGKVSRNNPRLN